jgi:predicted  nucleic acid-binding Zn-ribbon protein
MVAATAAPTPATLDGAPPRAAPVRLTNVSPEVGSERATLETLLDLQERDTAADRLRHRRDTLERREVLTQAEGRIADLEARLDDVGGRRDSAAREEQRFDDEARALETKAAEVERRLYSGEVASPRELQALQADVEQLRRHRRSLEDRELAVMEQREALDTELAELKSAAASIGSQATELREAVGREEATIDAELAAETLAREELASRIDAELLEEYERCRRHSRGAGAARLVGGTCQGCHLSIPATEAERIRKGPPGTVAHCDNCGCILVP